MGKAQSTHEVCEESGELQAAKQVVEERGVVGAQAVMREQLENWKNVKIKLGVAGDSGVGKSSFINRIRAIDNDEKGAAPTDVVETTLEPADYSYPDNPSIILMDLPGIGTPTFPTLEMYCEKVGLETYDTFLILTASRFTNNDLLLAQKIKSMEKSFFFIRTKIDVDEMNEKRKKRPDVETMSKRIRADCYKNIKDLGISEDEIFLICNHEQDKWDFQRLVQAILDKLPNHKMEALTLSLKIFSKDIVRRRVQVFKGQLWRVSLLFLAAWPLDVAALPLNYLIVLVGMFKRVFEYAKSEPGFSLKDFDEDFVDAEEDFDESMDPVGFASIPIALALLGRKSTFYRSQLGLPEKDSDEFQKMKPELQEKMKQFYPKEKKGLLKRFFTILLNPVKQELRGLMGVVMNGHPHKVLLKSLENLLDEIPTFIGYVR